MYAFQGCIFSMFYPQIGGGDKNMPVLLIFEGKNMNLEFFFWSFKLWGKNGYLTFIFFCLFLPK